MLGVLNSYDAVEYHTLYGVDRTRLTTRIPVTVLGKDSQYGKDRVWNVL